MKTMQDVLKDAMKNGGGTYYWHTSDDWEGWQKREDVTGDSGYWVAKALGIDNLPKLRKIIVDDFVECRDIKSRYDTSSYLGLWFDKENDTWSIDNVVYAFHFPEAERCARMYHQKAIWSIADKKEIRLS